MATKRITEPAVDAIVTAARIEDVVADLRTSIAAQHKIDPEEILTISLSYTLADDTATAATVRVTQRDRTMRVTRVGR